MTIPEPPNGAIVGWGDPIQVVKVRIDRFAEPDAPLERWFPAEESYGIDVAPVKWDDALAAHGTRPYLLVRQPIGGDL